MMHLFSEYWQLLLFGVCFGLVDYSVVPIVISLVASYCGNDVVGFQWKNPDFLLKNPELLWRNPDVLI